MYEIRNLNNTDFEVIAENEIAYALYKNKGGTVCREFSVPEGRINDKNNFEVKTIPLNAFPKENISKYELSFSNRIIALHCNAASYQIAFIENENRRSSVIFYEQGGISQIMFDELLKMGFTILVN